MSVTDQVRERQLRKVACTNAITALTAAGTAILSARGGGSDELVDALRDDIGRMVGDVQALQKTI